MKFVTSLQGDRNICDWTLEEFKQRLNAATPGNFTVYEYLTSDMIVKPYFDYDRKLDKYQNPELHVEQFVGNIAELFASDPRFSTDSIALAQRHRHIGDKYKISLRAYVQGYKVTPEGLKDVVQSHGLDKDFDVSVYSKKRKLGVLGGNKTADDRTPLTALTHEDDPSAFLAQYLRGDEQELCIREVALPQTDTLIAADFTEDVFHRMVTQATPLIERKLCNTISQVWKREGGFDFNVGDRNSPCRLCLDPTHVHTSNNYTVRYIISECFSLANYSVEECSSELLGWDKHKLLSDLREFPDTDEPYVRIFEAQEAEFGRQVKHDGTDFLIFNGKLWQYKSALFVGQKIRELASKYMLTLNIGFATMLKATKRRGGTTEYIDKLQEYKDQFQKGSRYIRKSNNVDTIVKIAKQILYDDDIAKKMDADKDLLGCTDGVIDLRTQTLRRQSDDYVSKQVNASFRSIDYPSPDIEAFFDSIFDHDADVVKYMQKLFGYALTGHTTEHKMIVCYGVGANGKSVMVNTVQSLFADYGVSMHKDCIIKGRRQSEGAAASHIMVLQGKRLAVCEETEEDCVLNEENVKAATGGSIISCREMYGKQTQFEATHQALLVTNNKPRFNSDSEAMRRRMVLVPFEMRYKDVSEFDTNDPTHRLKDPELSQRLAEPEARDQLLSWLLRGTKMWYEERLGEPPLKLLEATRQYIEENDSIGIFIKEHCEKGAGFYVITSEFKQTYEAATETTITPQKLAEKMKAKGYMCERVRVGENRPRVFKNLRLVPDETGPLGPVF